MLPSGWVDYPAFGVSAGTVITPNYMDNASARVAPWCDCGASGNRREECETFLGLFTRNRCLGEGPGWGQLWEPILEGRKSRLFEAVPPLSTHRTPHRCRLAPEEIHAQRRSQTTMRILGVSVLASPRTKQVSEDPELNKARLLALVRGLPSRLAPASPTCDLASCELNG